MIDIAAWLYGGLWAFLGILLFAGSYATFGFLVKYREIRRLRTLPSVFLELTPPARTHKTPLATQQLFALLHELSVARGWYDRLWHRRTVFSLEVLSTRENGIRYIVEVPVTDRRMFEQHITAYLPEVQIKAVPNYLSLENDDATRVIEFRQTGHVAYPLQRQTTLNQHDPISYLTNAMTQLESGELIALQLMLAPADSYKVSVMTGAVRGNSDLADQLNRYNFSLLRLLPYTLEFIIVRPLLFIVELLFFERKPTQLSTAAPAHRPTEAERELLNAIHAKAEQPAFHVNIRLLVKVHDPRVAEQRIKVLRTSLASYGASRYQSLQPRLNWPREVVRYRQTAFRYRLPSLFVKNACLLSVSEIADLYHFPYGDVMQTENLVSSHSRQLPAPLSLKQTPSTYVLGQNSYHNAITAIGLTPAERERHVYILGGTGNGKTTLMQYGIIQDMQAGEGVAVIDPHGDLAENLLRYVPEYRLDDVVYFNPDDLSWPIGLNLLELTPGLDGDDLLREKDLVTEAAISVFRKIFSDEDSGGHRIEYILRNAIQTALTVPDATLFTVFRLLTDPPYQRSIVKALDNPDLQRFWRNELGKAGEYQKVKMTAGITAKIGRFLFSAAARRVLEQPRSTINLDDLLAERKILICNFSKGLLGEDTAALFGITVLAKLQLAALRRARLPSESRTPFYLYVDEFQNFATTSFTQLLSEARKYKLLVTMAEQSTSQQKDSRMVNVILANVGTVVCFRTGNVVDEQLLSPLFRPFLTGSEIANLPPFHFYMRSAAVHAQEPLSGETLLVSYPGSKNVAEMAIAASRRNFARPYEAPEIEEMIPTRAPTTSQTVPLPLGDTAPSAR